MLCALIYVAGLAMTILCGVILRDGSWRERQTGARILLASPLWPVIVIIAVSRWFTGVIHDANLGGGERG